MTLTPKNWHEFQHYKDRKPSWIKLHRSLLDDYVFHGLPDASRALAPVLWLLASEYEDGIIPCTLQELAFRLRMSVKQLEVALSPLIESGFFNDSAPLAEPEQVASLEKERETQVTSKTEKNIINLEFEKFKKAFPKRKGGHGWPEAERFFVRAIKEGCNAADLILAAEKFGHSIESAVGTEFVPMAVKWMRNRLYLEFIPTKEEIEKAKKVEEYLAARGYAQTQEP